MRFLNLEYMWFSKTHNEQVCSVLGLWRCINNWHLLVLIIVLILRLYRHAQDWLADLSERLATLRRTKDIWDTVSGHDGVGVWLNRHILLHWHLPRHLVLHHLHLFLMLLLHLQHLLLELSLLLNQLLLIELLLLMLLLDSHLLILLHFDLIFLLLIYLLHGGLVCLLIFLHLLFHVILGFHGVYLHGF